MIRISFLVGLCLVGMTGTADAQNIYKPGDPYDPDVIYEDAETRVEPSQTTTKPVPAEPPLGRAEFYYAILDSDSKKEQPDLTITQTIRDSLNDLLVINYFDEQGQYSDYQRSFLRRSVAHLAGRLRGRDAKLLDVMAYTAEGEPVYAKEAQEAWSQNTLVSGAEAAREKPVLPYGQVFVHGQLVYDFAVSLGGEDGRRVADNARTIQSALKRIVGDLRDLPPLFDDQAEISAD